LGRIFIASAASLTIQPSRNTIPCLGFGGAGGAAGLGAAGACLGGCAWGAGLEGAAWGAAGLAWPAGLGPGAGGCPGRAGAANPVVGDVAEGGGGVAGLAEGAGTEGLAAEAGA